MPIRGQLAGLLAVATVIANIAVVLFAWTLIKDKLHIQNKTIRDQESQLARLSGRIKEAEKDFEKLKTRAENLEQEVRTLSKMPTSELEARIKLIDDAGPAIHKLEAVMKKREDVDVFGFWEHKKEACYIWPKANVGDHIVLVNEEGKQTFGRITSQWSFETGSPENAATATIDRNGKRIILGNGDNWVRPNPDSPWAAISPTVHPAAWRREKQ
jgi:hypothetical protein